jgi:hypothetical protein
MNGLHILLAQRISSFYSAHISQEDESNWYMQAPAYLI